MLSVFHINPPVHDGVAVQAAATAAAGDVAVRQALAASAASAHGDAGRESLGLPVH